MLYWEDIIACCLSTVCHLQIIVDINSDKMASERLSDLAKTKEEASV